MNQYTSLQYNIVQYDATSFCVICYIKQYNAVKFYHNIVLYDKTLYEDMISIMLYDIVKYDMISYNI